MLSKGFIDKLAEEKLYVESQLSALDHEYKALQTRANCMLNKMSEVASILDSINSLLEHSPSPFAK